MSRRRGGLFSGRPDLLLVDERPPGIKLPELVAQAPIPDLEDDEEEVEPDLGTDDDESEADDSYDGEGPLRIFIGTPAAAAADAAGEAPSITAEAGPIWDASALALGAGEGVDEAVDDLDSDRAPVLLRPGDSDEPPPLTMSFGGSFSRGSMDAGVMDEEDLPSADSSAEARTDTVVVHDRIYDRVLRFEDPTLPPSSPSSADDPSTSQPMRVGPAEDASDEIIGVGDVAAGVDPGPPPTRLRVGHLPAADADDEDDDDGVDVVGWGDELVDDDDDDDGDDDGDGDGDGDALDSLDRRLGEAMRRGLARSLMDEDDDLPSASPRVVLRDPDIGSSPDQVATTPGVEDETEERPLVLPPTQGAASGSAPDWAVRRRAAQVGSIRVGEDVQDDDEDSEGGGVGLLVFVVVAIVILIGAWWFYGREGATGLPLFQGGTTAAETASSDSSKAPAAAEAEVETAPEPADVAEGAEAGAPAGADAAPASGVRTFVPEGADPGSIDPADLGVLRVRATRPARIYIDGRLVGETPMSAISLPGGDHTVKAVSISSGRSRTQAVRVDPGRSQELRFTF